MTGEDDRRPLRYLSVCSGIEAASVAWGPLGFTPVAFSEIDKFPSAVLAHHYPDVPNYGDMTKFQEWPDAAVDVLVGGTPCQSFSVAGLRAGLADPRGNLMLTFLAIARRYAPRWIVWENVPGVLSSNDGRDFGAFLGGLAECGYRWAYRVLDAQYFGLAQRRKRVFVVAHLGDWRRAAAVLLEPESLQGHPAPRREAGQVAPTVPARRTAGGGLGSDFDCDGVLTLCADIAPTLNAHFGTKQGLEDQHINGGAGLFVAHSLRADGFDAGEDGTGRGTPIVPIAFYQNEGSHGSGDNRNLSPTLKGSGNQSNYAAVAFQLNGDRNNPGPNSEETFQTLCKDRNPAVMTAMQVRRLTPRECARLQGFPDDFLDITYRGKPASDGPKYKALGNSMAVPCMRWIGERIKFLDSL